MNSSVVRLFTALLLLTFAAAPFTAFAGKAAPDMSAWPFAPTFEFTAEYIGKIGTDAMKLCNEKLDALVKIPADKRTFENTVTAFEDATVAFMDTVNLPQFMGYVHTDKAIRDVASVLEEASTKYMVELSTRRDLYNAMKELADRKPELAAEDQYLLDRTLLDFKRSGLALADDKLKVYKELKQKLVGIELAFEKNIREYKNHIEVTREQLAGLPEDYISKLKKTPEGKFIVTLDYPDYFPFMDNATNEEARKALEAKFNNRCADTNVALMEEALQVRQQIADVLGYANHASYVLEDRMAKKPETVFSFMDKLIERLQPKGKDELKTRIELKAKETGKPVDMLNNWDFRYFNNKYKMTALDLDHEKIKEYFPLDHLMSTMLEVYGTIFGVTFKQAPLPVWHEEVTAYEVRDENNELKGYFYLDLFPREGKYKHMACFGMMETMIMPDGSRRKPSAAIVGNFPRPGAGAPAMLKHNDVETMFHEFGHVCHHLFSKAKYASLAGTSVSRDFVEVPSTIMEDWAWHPEVLKKISKHYKTGEALPDELIKKLVDSRNIDAGLVQLRQLFFSKFDMMIHTTERKNTTALYEKMQNEIQMIPMTKGCAPQASFGHLMGGYDSGYYGYLWARVISSDIFSEFEKNGVFDPATGKKYCDIVLGAGRVADDAAVVATFLGRPFNEDAFINKLGLGGNAQVAAPVAAKTYRQRVEEAFSKIRNR